jgi:hypothetical protein
MTVILAFVGLAIYAMAKKSREGTTSPPPPEIPK